MVLPRRARAHVFGEAARASASPQTVLAAVAASLGVTLEDLQDSLFADLPGERIVAEPAQPVSAVEFALRCNLALVQEMLFRAAVVRVEVEGNTRVLVRHAKWRGLICTVADRSDGISTSMEISGPFALFATLDTMDGPSANSSPSWRGVRASICTRDASSRGALSLWNSVPAIPFSPPVLRADTTASWKSVSLGSSDGSLPRGM